MNPTEQAFNNFAYVSHKNVACVIKTTGFLLKSAVNLNFQFFLYCMVIKSFPNNSK